MFYAILGAILTTTAPLTATSEAPVAVAHKDRKYVTTQELKSWYDQKKSMVVLDARSKTYFDGRLLPNAIWLPADSSEKKISATIPNKDSVVVVYCSGVRCPASGRLYGRLQSMGYHDIYEFHEGLDGWIRKGYPVTED